MSNSDFERGVAVGKAIESVDGCICRGNWRAILAEVRPLIGRRFMNRGLEYTFFGVVDGEDDYYYGMYRAGEMRLLSCVGSIEGFGFTLIEPANKAIDPPLDQLSSGVCTGCSSKPCVCDQLWSAQRRDRQ